MDYQYSFQIYGNTVPYYHFHYEKEFKEVIRIKNIQEKNRSNRYYFKDGTYLPQFVNQETAKQFNFNSDYATFEKAIILIIHSFSDEVPKDLDNYYYKPFIDVIRKLKIIEDDSWEQAGITNLGSYADNECIDVYVVPYQFYIYFLSQKLDYLFNGNYRISSIKEQEKREEMGNDFFDPDIFS